MTCSILQIFYFPCECNSEEAELVSNAGGRTKTEVEEALSGGKVEYLRDIHGGLYVTFQRGTDDLGLHITKKNSGLDDYLLTLST
jgi:hypothetical protein